MSIRRTRRPDTYTVLDNGLFHASLSFEAVGVLAYLLSKPEDWIVSAIDIVNFTRQSERPMGRDKVYEILSELRRKGFIKRIGQRAEGRFGGYQYEVYDQAQAPDADAPVFSGPAPRAPLKHPSRPASVQKCEVDPLPSEPETGDSPFPDLPDTAKPTLQSTDIKQSKEIRAYDTSAGAGASCGKPSPVAKPKVAKQDKPAKQTKPVTVRREYSEAFEAAWKAYPPREGDNPKGKAYTQWCKRLEEGESVETLMAGVARYAAYCKTRQIRKYVQQGSRFFGEDKPYLNTWTVLSAEGDKGRSFETVVSDKDYTGDDEDGVISFEFT